MQRTLLALALIASAGASVSYAQAQTYASPSPMVSRSLMLSSSPCRTRPGRAMSRSIPTAIR